MYIFISHSSKEADIAKKVCTALEENQKKCFIAPRDIRSGHEYAEEIVEGIDKSDAMLLLLSEASNKSPHVLREVERAVSKNIPIIICKLEEVTLTKSMEYFLMTHHWLDVEKGIDFVKLTECVDSLDKSKKNLQNSSNEKNVHTIRKENKKKKKILKWIAAGATTTMLVIGIIGAVFIKKSDEAPAADDAGATTKNSDSEPVLSKAEENVSNSAIGEASTNENDEAVSKNEKDIELGDTITIGSYNNEALVWRVLHIDEEKKQAILISENIITMKAYDAAESGKFNSDGQKDYWSQNSEATTDMDLQAYVRGNSDWSKSNIRTWLNSDRENVKYEDQEPSAKAMSEAKNGYNNEAGFLNGFTEEELDRLLEIEIITNPNALSDEAITTTDRVFLLSEEELEWFEEADISLYAEPTNAAIEQDKTGWYNIFSLSYEVNEYYWWLREPVEGTSAKCYLVSNGYSDEKLIPYTVGLEGFGIRPAIVISTE